jgi:hypothetical protein
MATKKTATKKTTKAPAPAAKTPSKRGSTASSAEAPVVKKAAPGGAEPTWGKSTVLIKGGGMAPQKATQIHVEMPDGAVASQKAADNVAIWPSVRLRIVFGHSDSWYGKSGEERREKAIRGIMKMAEIAKPSFINQDVIGRADIPVLKPTPYKKADAQKLLERTLFVEQRGTGTPWVVMRTGGALDVRYDASVVVLDDSVQLHLPATAENVERLEKALDVLVNDLPFAWAGVGYGWGGWASALALLQSTMKVRPIQGVGLKTLEQRVPSAGLDWLVWIGDVLRETPAQAAVVDPLGSGTDRTVTRRGSLMRIALPRPTSPEDAKGRKPAEKLAADLGDVLKKIRDLQTRAVLRRPVPGSRR